MAQKIKLKGVSMDSKNLTAKELEVLQQQKEEELTLMVEAFSNLEDGVPLFDFQNASEEERKAILEQLESFSLTDYDDDIPMDIQAQWQD